MFAGEKMTTSSLRDPAWDSIGERMCWLMGSDDGFL